MSGGIAIFILNFGTRWRWGCALALRPEKDSQLPTELYACWAPDPFYMLWRRAAFLTPSGCRRAAIPLRSSQ